MVIIPKEKNYKSKPADIRVVIREKSDKTRGIGLSIRSE